MTNKEPELPGSTVPPRYEMPTSPASRPYLSPSSSTKSSDSKGSANSYSTRATTPGASPGPNRNSYAAPAAARGSENNGIKKYTVNVFCPRKEDSAGQRREEIPRDLREFRLAKLALIPVVAGTRKLVSLDVIFGEIDKPVASLLEKHFLC